MAPPAAQPGARVRARGRGRAGLRRRRRCSSACRRGSAVGGQLARRDASSARTRQSCVPAAGELRPAPLRHLHGQRPPYCDAPRRGRGRLRRRRRRRRRARPLASCGRSGAGRARSEGALCAALPTPAPVLGGGVGGVASPAPSRPGRGLSERALLGGDIELCSSRERPLVRLRVRRAAGDCRASLTCRITPAPAQQPGSDAPPARPSRPRAWARPWPETPASPPTDAASSPTPAPPGRAATASLTTPFASLQTVRRAATRRPAGLRLRQRCSTSTSTCPAGVTVYGALDTAPMAGSGPEPRARPSSPSAWSTTPGWSGSRSSSRAAAAP